MTKLALDLDGCFFDFCTPYADLLIEVDGVDRLPEGWRKDPELHMPTWYWERHYGYSKEVEAKVWDDHILPSKDFWLKLKPLPFARETLMELNQLQKEGHEVYYLSHRHGKTALIQTQKALYEQGVDYPSVILTGNKRQIISALDIEFFVDDKTETLYDLALGMDAAPGMFKCHGGIYLKSAPYNRGNWGSTIQVVGSVKEALQKAGLWRA